MFLSKRKRLLVIGIVLALLAGLIYVLFFTKMGVKLTHLNMQQLASFLKSLNGFGKLIGMLLVLVQTIFPFIPFVLVAGTNVAIFGLKMGFLVNYVMACAGAIISFLFARYYAHAWVEKKLEKIPAAVQFNKRMVSHGFLYIMIGRLIPVIPSFAINLGAAVTRVSFRQFLAGTLVGKLPIIFMESMIAHDLFNFHKYRGRLLIFLIVFGILIIVGNLFKKKLIPKG